MGITAGYFSDVIGSEQALQASAQQVQSVAQQGLTELSFASSILNLPNADNPAGWTLGTYGGQTTLPISTTRALTALDQNGILDLSPMPGEKLFTIYKGIPNASIMDVCPTCFTNPAHLNPRDIIMERLETGKPLLSFFDEHYYSNYSPFGSWTNNLETAKRYTGSSGKIISIRIPETLVIDVNALDPQFTFYNDYEFLVPGIIPQASQIQVFP